MNEQTPITHIKSSLVKALLIALLSGLLVGLILFSDMLNDMSTQERGFMQLGTVLFGGILLLSLYILIRRPFFVTITPQHFVQASMLGIRQTIPWSAVQGFRTFGMGGNHFILVDVSKPHDYLKQVTNRWGRRTVRNHYKGHGTTVVLNAGFLNIKHDALLELLQEAHRQYRNEAAAPFA